MNAGATESSSTAGAEPDLALLEYLGGLVEDDGKWVGPEDMRGSDDARDIPFVLDEDADESR